jgi:polyphosphate kinase
VESEESQARPHQDQFTDHDNPELTVADGRGPSRFLNRELSWLDFDERILALAARRSLPELERAKFFAIFSENME